MSYALGTVVPMTATVKNEAGTPVVPTSATVSILRVATMTVAGPFAVTPAIPLAYDYTPPAEGRYAWRFDSVGPTTVIEDVFDVRATFPAYILGLAEAKRKLDIPATVATHDEDIRSILAGVTKVIEDHTGKTIAPRTVVDSPRAYRQRELWLDHAPILSVTSIATTDTLTTWTVGDIDIERDMGRLTARTGPYFHGDLAVTYVAGMGVIPANYLEAAKLILKSQWQPNRGSTTLSPYPGGLEDAVQVDGLSHPVPAKALAMLGPRPPMVA